MVIALDPKRTFEHVVEADRDLPEEQRTTFLLRCLTAGEEAALEDRHSNLSVDQDTGTGAQHARMELRLHARNVAFLHLGLVGWRNLRDAEGNEVPFRTNGKQGLARQVPDDLLSRLPREVRDELANAVQSRGELTEEQASD